MSWWGPKEGESRPVARLNCYCCSGGDLHDGGSDHGRYTGDEAYCITSDGNHREDGRCLKAWALISLTVPFHLGGLVQSEEKEFIYLASFMECFEEFQKSILINTTISKHRRICSHESTAFGTRSSLGDNDRTR